MTDTPVTYRDYYGRLGRAFGLDLWRLGGEQVAGAIVAILVLFFQWYYGLIPQNRNWQAFKTFAWPYLIILAIFVLLSAVRAPVAVDRQREKDLEQGSTEIESLKESSRIEAERRAAKFSFWLEPEASGDHRNVIMRYPIANSAIHGDIPEISLVVLNEGATTLKVLGFSIGIDEENAKPLACERKFGVPPHQQVAVKVTDTLMDSLCRLDRVPPGGAVRWDYSKIQGDHAMKVSIGFERDGKVAESEPKRQYVRAPHQVGSGSLGIEISDHPFS